MVYILHILSITDLFLILEIVLIRENDFIKVILRAF